MWGLLCDLFWNIPKPNLPWPKTKYQAVVDAAKIFVEFEALTENEEIMAYLPMAWIGDHIFSYGEAMIAGLIPNCPKNTFYDEFQLYTACFTTFTSVLHIFQRWPGNRLKPFSSNSEISAKTALKIRLLVPFFPVERSERPVIGSKQFSVATTKQKTIV